MRLACRVAGCHSDPESDIEREVEVEVEQLRPTPPSSVPSSEGVLAHGLSKIYPGGTVGAADVSLSAAPGEIVAVVGPNGAGKSTTLNMLSGLIRPSSGHASIAGVPLREPRRVSRFLGVALQSSGLDPLMTGSEHIDLQAALYDVDPATVKSRRTHLLEQFDLLPVADRQVGQYSGGMQRRLALALALVHDPPVVIFDEPTAGLDPQARRSMWALLNDLSGAGRTILFSTQLLEEADLFAQRVYILAGGRIVAAGTPDELRAAVGGLSLRVRVSAPVSEAEAILHRSVPELGSPRIEAESLVYVGSPSIGRCVQRAVDALADARIELLELTMGRPALEDAYVRFIGQAAPLEPLVHAQTGRGGCRCQ